MTDLFIGVVSHQGSRFSQNQGEHGLAATLQRRLSDAGVATALVVNTQDSWSPELLQITPSIALASVSASLAFEQAWQRYLNEDSGTPFLARTRKFWEFRARRWALSYRSKKKRFAASSMKGVQRLANIELSHVDLWKQGVASGARWVLILEDDAGCADVEDLTAGLLGLMNPAASSSGEGGVGRRYANISASFESHELGVDHLLSATELAWSGTMQRTIQAASRPVTNTVCAILYNAELLSLILTKFEELPFSPVIPIDFKLNEALIALFRQGQIGDGDCLQVEPAPIVQMSMHEMG